MDVAVELQEVLGRGRLESEWRHAVEGADVASRARAASLMLLSLQHETHESRRVSPRRPASYAAAHAGSYSPSVFHGNHYYGSRPRTPHQNCIAGSSVELFHDSGSNIGGTPPAEPSRRGATSPPIRAHSTVPVEVAVTAVTEDIVWRRMQRLSLLESCQRAELARERLEELLVLHDRHADDAPLATFAHGPSLPASRSAICSACRKR